MCTFHVIFKEIAMKIPPITPLKTAFDVGLSVTAPEIHGWSASIIRFEPRAESPCHPHRPAVSRFNLFTLPLRGT